MEEKEKMKRKERGTKKKEDTSGQYGCAFLQRQLQPAAGDAGVAILKGNCTMNQIKKQLPCGFSWLLGRFRDIYCFVLEVRPYGQSPNVLGIIRWLNR